MKNGWKKVKAPTRNKEVKVQHKWEHKEKEEKKKNASKSTISRNYTNASCADDTATKKQVLVEMCCKRIIRWIFKYT